jgi:Fe-S cluster biogenesis protein NfuA/nitrite reductase/ring-hydroxylating ferredoxin subunit
VTADLDTDAPEHLRGGVGDQAETVGTDLAATGDRIERLLEASATAGPLARERAEELVRLVTDLYGAGIERILEIAFDAGSLSDLALDALADDELVSSLLLVHGLHPYAVEDRIARALDKVRPYLGSHGGDVALLEVTDDGVARLQMLGSCDGCASSAVTLSSAIEGAVRGAAPEVVSIEVVEESAPAGSPIISIDALTARLRENGSGATSWRPVVASADLAVGVVASYEVAGERLVLARVGADVFAYADGCPGCGADLAGASLERQLGGAATVVLTCLGCRAHFDIRHAGAGLDGTEGHLSPLPLLQRDGVVEVAVATDANDAETAGVPA